MPDVCIHQKDEADFCALLQRLKNELSGKAGAVGCFVGLVRDTSEGGKRVKYLHYEYSEETAKKLERIAADIEKMPGILRVMIHPVSGDLKPGEETVYVLVAGERRAEVFSALSRIVDRFKAEVPKQEVV